MAVESLDTLGLKYGTDKASNEHDYCKIYDSYFSAFRNDNISLIEAGVGGYEYEDRGGQSLRMWYEYFPSAKIIGIDFYAKKGIINDRTEFWQGSQTDQQLFEAIFEREAYACKRIFIDDASHNNPDTINTFQVVFPLIAPGDFYICEDVHTSYFGDLEYQGDQNPEALNTSMFYFSNLTHQLNSDHLKPEYQVKDFAGKLEFIHFYKELVIIQKK